MSNCAALPELDRECGECQGNGIVTTPEWLEWRNREVAAEAVWRAAHAGESWFASAECGVIAEEQPEPEMPCPGCDGTGSQVTEAGRVILAFLSRHGGKR